MIPNLLQKFSLLKGFVLDDIAMAGDGGSVLLWLSDSKSDKLTVIFYQTRIPENYVDPENPTFFLINEIPIPVRSAIEKHVLSELKDFRFSISFSLEDQQKIREIINERIDFIESDDYLLTASQSDL